MIDHIGGGEAITIQTIIEVMLKEVQPNYFLSMTIFYFILFLVTFKIFNLVIGYHDESHNSSRPYYKHRDDTVPNHSSPEVGTSSADSPPRPKSTRRGRFTHHSRSKDDAKFSNGSVQNPSEIVPKVTREIEGK